MPTHSILQGMHWHKKFIFCLFFYLSVYLISNVIIIIIICCSFGNDYLLQQFAKSVLFLSSCLLLMAWAACCLQPWLQQIPLLIVWIFISNLRIEFRSILLSSTDLHLVFFLSPLFLIYITYTNLTNCSQIMFKSRLFVITDTAVKDIPICKRTNPLMSSCCVMFFHSTKGKYFSVE